MWSIPFGYELWCYIWKILFDFKRVSITGLHDFGKDLNVTSSFKTNQNRVLCIVSKGFQMSFNAFKKKMKNAWPMSWTVFEMHNFPNVFLRQEWKRCLNTKLVVTYL